VTGTDRARLQRLLAGPDTAWILERLRRRLERGRPLTGTLTRAGATPAERHAAAQLLGRGLRPGGSVSVPLDELESVLVRAGAAGDLRAAVEALTGPVADAAAAAAEHEAAWTAVLAGAQEWAAARGLGGWLEEVRARGLLRRLAGGEPDRGEQLLAVTRQVIQALPVTGVPRARLAADVLGDSHALDDDRPVATLVLRALEALAESDPDTDLRTAEGRRRVWAGAGVLVGELAAPVLTLGLRAAGTGVTARMLAAARDAGEAVHLTLRQLVRDPPAWPATTVSICENPTVVAAAADLLGTDCAPLVCTHGQPSTAVNALLDQLVDAGAALRYHGDFDWPGLVIANGMIGRRGATPWLMSTDHYLAAAPRSTRPLEGTSTAAVWDPGLAPAMTRHGVRVEEELVLDALLADLR
jgi:uncharacterized protein (TIGR02679 family)